MRQTKLKSKSKNHSARRSTRLAIKTPHLSPYLIIAVIAIIGILVWYNRPRSFTPPILEVGQSTGIATLALSPNSSTITPHTQVSLTLSVTGGDNHLTGAQIELTYDSSILGTPTVTFSEHFPVVLSNTKIENNKLKFTIGAAANSGGKTGSFNLATLTFTPIQVGSATLSFTENTLITATELTSSNALRSVSNATITVASAEASPSPASSTKASPSVSPSASPSISPSPSPTNNISKPDKPTGLRSNCYNNGTRITLRWDQVPKATSYKLRLDQKDGTNDKSIDNLAKTEYDFDIIANQNYSWWVHAHNEGGDSEEAKIDSVKCESSNTSTNSPTPTPTPTPKPTTKATPKTSAKPTPSPSTTSLPTASLFPISSPGSLSDIFNSPTPLPNSNQSTAKPGFFHMIYLGWRAILEKLADVFK